MKKDRILVLEDTRLTNICVPCKICGKQPLIGVADVDGEKRYKLFCSSHKPHNAAGGWFDGKVMAAQDWNNRQEEEKWNPEQNLGKRLLPCPFCKRRMVFQREECINHHGKPYIHQYYMHDYSEKDIDSLRCVLDEVSEVFSIPAGDARPEDGYIGEYAELWNKRSVLP